MSTNQALTALRGNDTTWQLQAFLNGMPLNLSGYTLKCYVKASSTATDASGTTYTAGSGITVVNSGQGIINFTVPATALTTPGTQWWHWDITDGSNNNSTVMYGPLTILAV